MVLLWLLMVTIFHPVKKEPAPQCLQCLSAIEVFNFFLVVVLQVLVYHCFYLMHHFQALIFMILLARPLGLQWAGFFLFFFLEGTTVTCQNIKAVSVKTRF